MDSFKGGKDVLEDNQWIMGVSKEASTHSQQSEHGEITWANIKLAAF